MTKDIDALVAAADALAEATQRLTANLTEGDFISATRIDAAIYAAKEYRAAREAVRKGTPPAFATSA